MSTNQNVLDLFASLAKGQQEIAAGQSQLIRTACALALGPEPVSVPSIPALPPATEAPAQADPKAQDDELMESIMTELDHAKAEGLTPRDLGKRVQAQVPGKSSVPPHQRYKFRQTMQRLVSDKRIVRLDPDDPKRLRYCIAAFAVESP